jgi:glutamine amidotransferase
MIAVIDYGIGNVRSVLNAFEYIGTQAVLTRDPVELAKASGLVLPGVGAFGEGMRRLDSHGLREPLMRLACTGKPLLGICLGFQMLMRSSTEQGQHDGLALIDNDVVRLPVDARLPHIGWSPVKAAADSPAASRLLSSLDDELFYFVHSYGVLKPVQPVVVGLTRYADCEISALIESGNVMGTQFHPEKSGEAGLQMLKNFRNLCL